MNSNDILKDSGNNLTELLKKLDYILADKDETTDQKLTWQDKLNSLESEIDEIISLKKTDLKQPEQIEVKRQQEITLSNQRQIQ